MSNKEINAAMQQKLQTVGLGFETIKVFTGNVHVTCRGRDTAHKWAVLLNGLFGAKVSLVPTMWEAAKNKGTNLQPTMRKGFLVAVSA